ncbi:MAG TPA: class I SAM-dependent methyltransferase [Gaiellaceae bacterium]|nr:class I SAM-dependent methyltransferase [Gaiellaceae bacterium]
MSVLDRPLVWEASRVGLDVLFGLYRRRRDILRRWGLLDGDPRVLDIGCGIGQYASVTAGRYVGVDLNCAYVDHARRRRGDARHTFQCVDAAELVGVGERFDLVLMVDFLHHLPDEAAVSVLRTARELTTGRVVSLEPVTEQENRLGRWFIENDRGEHMRPHGELLALFEAAGLAVEADEPLRLGPIATRAIRSVPAGPPS